MMLHRDALCALDAVFLVCSRRSFLIDGIFGFDEAVADRAAKDSTVLCAHSLSDHTDATLIVDFESLCAVAAAFSVCSRT